MKNKSEIINQEKLKELLDYDPETGLFSQKTPSRITTKAWTTTGKGYIRIRIYGKQYRAHRLAWLYVNGYWPSNYIDHINGIRSDNRISNLRDVTNRQNHQNRKIHIDGKLVGTYFNKKINKWQAFISISGKKKFIGNFNNQTEAHQAYLLECSKLS